MEPVNLFGLASKQAQWLSLRQSSIAGNIANANTPGYTATDVQSFEKVLDQASSSLRSTQSGHLGNGITQAGFAIKQQDFAGALMPSKNTVVVEDELVKAGEVRRAFELNTAIVKAFHSMMITAVKG